MSAGLALKRPPHIDWLWDLAEGVSDMGGSKRTKAIGVAVAAGIAVIGISSLLYVNRDSGGKGSDAQSYAATPLKAHATGPFAKLMTPEPTPAPEYRFFDADGKPVSFADFKGKVTVVNLWATWCAPCKLEMPTLAALADRYKDRDDFAVVVISVDTERAEKAARDFISGLPPLAYYADPKFQLPFEFAGKGAMPQTILLDRQGQVVAIMVGEADWNGPQAVALIDGILARN